MRFDKESGKRLWEKVKDTFITDQVFIENEYKTNKFVAKLMIFMAANLVLSYVLNEVGIYNVSRKVMFSVTVQGCLEFLIPAAICFALKGRTRWLKYLMMLEFVVVFARIDSVLTYTVIPIMFIPVVVSCCYYSRVFTAQISVFTMILFAVSTYCGAALEMGDKDLNIYNADPSHYVMNMMLQSYVPKLIIFIVVSFICYEIAYRCRKMVLKQHDISEEHTRVETELALASRIQTQALPIVHDLPKQDHSTFDLAAFMEPAKEVGGDFYDFFYLDPKHLALMIADVSGKGVPAALFMMVSKILLDNSFDKDHSPGKVLTEVNHQLCEKQLEDMFVTVWLGVLDLETGQLVSASAGHEYPMMAKAGQDFQLVKDKHGLVLGGMDGVRYRETTMQLEPGDILFVYTDGVPEANDPDNRQFGIEQTLRSLSKNKDMSMEEMLKAVKADIDAFANGAPPFDDTTMLALRYERNLTTEGITVRPGMDTFPQVMEYVEGELEKAGVDVKKMHKVSLVVDELFANIVNYSGADWAQVICQVSEEQIDLYIRDNGVPYNPLEAPAPDLESSAEEREIGGLGIFLSRTMMDDMAYRYVNGVNVVKAMMKR